MTLPVLAQIKTWAIIALGAIAAFFGISSYRQKAKHEAAKRKGAEKRAEVERDAHEELTEGLNREQESKDEIADRISKRDYFG